MIVGALAVVVLSSRDDDMLSSYAQGYDLQLGADKKFVKYMPGQLYGLTFALARLITFNHIDYSVLYQM